MNTRASRWGGVQFHDVLGVEDGYIVPVSSTAQSISTEAKIIENKWKGCKDLFIKQTYVRQIFKG